MTRKSKRFAIMLKHKELVKNGDYETAWGLLYLLRKHEIDLGYSDSSFEVERICEKIGCHISYRGRYYIAHVYDWGK